MPADPYLQAATILEAFVWLLVAYLLACGVSAIYGAVLDRQERARLARIAERPSLADAPSLSSTHNPQTR